MTSLVTIKLVSKIVTDFSVTIRNPSFVNHFLRSVISLSVTIVCNSDRKFVTLALSLAYHPSQFSVTIMSLPDRKGFHLSYLPSRFNFEGRYT